MAVVLPLPREVAGAQRIFVDPREMDDSPGPLMGFNCWLCRIPSSHGGRSHVVALAQPTLTGNNHAAICVMRLRARFQNLKYVVLCGIAGAAPTPEDPDRDIHLGDLVIADRGGILQYDFGHVRRNGDGQSLTSGRPPIAPDDVFLDIANRLATMDIQGDRPWLARLDQRLSQLVAMDARFARPLDGPGVFSYERVDGAAVETIERKPRYTESKLFRGAIGSANCVLKDPFRRDQLRDGTPKILAVEMEGAGVADACRACGLHFTVVRAICDFCDRHKKDIWQFHAAAAAAALAYCVIQHLPSELPGVRTGETGPHSETTELVRIGQQAVPEGARSASLSVGTNAFLSRGRRYAAYEPPIDSPTDGAANGGPQHQTASTPVGETGPKAELDSFLRIIEIETAQRNWSAMIAAARAAEATFEEVGDRLGVEARAHVLSEIARSYVLWSIHAPEPERPSSRERATALIRALEELSK